ncbi:MAG: DNA gyrase inhibitor YacG [Proteobacteria bacterium]|nr:DNA gyrase inhibitor YacG [Pseudomonadota bacterium]
MVEYHCPTCKQKLTEQGEFFPFCSKRCKLQDLGAWASGAYAVPGDEATDEDLAAAVRDSSREPPHLGKRRPIQ